MAIKFLNTVAVDTDVLYVDASSNRVGVGTSSPGATFHVSGGAIRIDDSQQLQFGNGNVRINNDASGRMYLRAPLAYYFEGNGGYKMVLDGNSGNLGIGTTSPAKKLTIGGIGLGNTDGLKIEDPSNTAYGAHYSYDDGSTTVEIGGVVNNALRDCISIARDATRTITINTSEYVGIGTTSPQAKLHVSNGTLRTWAPTSGTSAIFESTVGNRNFVTLTAANEAELWFGNASTQTLGRIRYEMAGNNMEFWTNATQKMVINSSGNVGIGTTSPGDKLHVEGTVRADSPATSGWAFQGRNNLNTALSGIWFDNGDGELLLRDDANNLNVRLRSDSDSYFNGGNVGIGTTSPQRKFHVDGIARIEANGQTLDLVGTDHTFIGFYPDGAASGRKAYIGFPGSTSDRLTIANEFNDDISFFTNGSEKVTIENSGDVGIGTTSPSEKLHVYNGKAYVTPISYASNQSAYALKIGAYNNTAFDMGLQAKSTSGGSPYMSLRTPSNDDTLVIWGDKVGIKTAPNLSYNLDINGTLRTVGDSYFDDDIHLGRYIFHAGDTNTWLGFPTSDTISFRTSGSDRMYINSSGNVGIGTTSPTSRFHVKQTLASPSVPMAYFEADRGPSAYGAVNVRVDNLEYGTGMRFYKSATYDSSAIGFMNGASAVGNISINTTSTSYNTTSDYRLKENLTEITDGIDRIKQLQPKRFNFIGNTSVVDGFIAHEAQDVVPEAVTGSKDEVLPNGDPLYQGIDQAKIVPLLTAALQEAIAKIELLENRLQTLENK